MKKKSIIPKRLTLLVTSLSLLAVGVLLILSVAAGGIVNDLRDRDEIYMKTFNDEKEYQHYLAEQTRHMETLESALLKAIIAFLVSLYLLVFRRFITSFPTLIALPFLIGSIKCMEWWLGESVYLERLESKVPYIMEYFPNEEAYSHALMVAKATQAKYKKLLLGNTGTLIFLTTFLIIQHFRRKPLNN